MVVAPLPTRDSAALPRFHGCLAFFHRHFPPQPSASHPLDPSFQSQQPPSPWVGLTIPKLQLPATVPSGVGTSAARTVLILIPFRLPQISSFPLSLKCFSSDSDKCSDVGVRPLLQFPTAEGGSSPANTLVFPPVPSSYRVLHGSIHSFCCSGTPVCSQLLFWMHICV